MADLFKEQCCGSPSENDPNVCAIVFVRSGSTALIQNFRSSRNFAWIMVLAAFSFIGPETSLALNELRTKIDWCEN